MIYKEDPIESPPWNPDPVYVRGIDMMPVYDGYPLTFEDKYPIASPPWNPDIPIETPPYDGYPYPIFTPPIDDPSPVVTVPPPIVTGPIVTQNPVPTVDVPVTTPPPIVTLKEPISAQLIP